MRVYPDIASRRLSTVARDAVVALLLVLFAWLALAVHDAVDELAVLGEGVRGAGGAVSEGFGAAADAVDGTPVVGDDLAEGLRDAGGASGGNVEELGTSGERSAHRLADLLGVLAFVLPAALVLFHYLPDRVRQIRRLTAASKVLAGSDGERRRLIAMRAAFSLPYGDLLRHTRDPLGDLAEERYDALVAAELESAGLKPPDAKRVTSAT